MHESSLHEEVEATLNRLITKHQGLKTLLKDAYGYAVFPSVGRASVVLGVAAGDGEVFEQGKSIGFANVRQLTIGVQVGGQTFGELLIFDSAESLEHFKTGPVKFTANASAVLVKTGASGTTDFGGVNAMAFSDGGELLELSLGGQKFNFQPPGAAAEEAAGKDEKEEKGEKEGGIKDRFSKVASRIHWPQGRKAGARAGAENTETETNKDEEGEEREETSEPSSHPPSS